MVLKKHVDRLKKKASFELSKEGLKERLSDETISDKWKLRRKYAMYAFILSSILLSTSFPFELAIWALKSAEILQLISILLGGRAQLNKK